MSDDLSILLGKKVDDPSIRGFVINTGMKPSIDEFEDRLYYSFKPLGIGLVFDENETLIAIQFYGEGRDPGFSAYKNELPHGVKFSDSKEAVIRKLGKPDKQGGGRGIVAVPALGEIKPWIRYTYPTYTLQFQFNFNGSAIGLAEVSSKNQGKNSERP